MAGSLGGGDRETGRLLAASALTQREAAAMVVACCCLAAMGWMFRRRQPSTERLPWLLFTAAGGFILLGRLALTLQEPEVGSRPQALWIDGVSLVGSGLLVAGAISLLRSRWVALNVDTVLNALLLGLIMTTLGAVLVFLPLVTGNQPVEDRLLAAAVSSVQVALVALAAWLALGRGARTPSWYMLAGGWAVLIVADRWPGRSPAPLPIAYLPFVLMAAAAALPASRALTAPPRPEAQLSVGRFVLVGVAMLVPCGLLVAALVRDRSDAVGVLALTLTVDGGLVVGALVALVRSKERTAHQEEALRALAADLLTAMDTVEIERSATTAACQLAGPGSTARLVSPQEAQEPAVQTDQVTVLPFHAQTGLLGGLALTSRRPLAAETRRALDQLVDHVSLALLSAKLRDEVHWQRSERRFRAFIDHSSDLVAVVGPDGSISFASPAAERLIGMRAELLVGLKPLALVHDEDRPRAGAFLDAAWADGQPQDSVEVRLQRLDGSWRWFVVAASAFESDGVSSLLLNLRDVHDRKQAETTLAEREARFSALVRHASDLVLVLDGDRHIRWASPSSSRLLGVRDEDLTGVPFSDFVHVDCQGVVDRLIDSPDERPQELQLRNAVTGWRTISVTATDLRHVSAVRGIVLNARDVTEAKDLENQLFHRAHHDTLTDLPNRALFAQRVEEALATASAKGSHVVVLFIDLDDFKTVNDGLGHGTGDLVLSVEARRVSEAASPYGMAARLGGDEFAVLLEGPDAPRLAGQVGVGLVKSLARPISTHFELPVQLSASIGIATNDVAGNSVSELLRGADIAMYLAKSRGKGRVERYEAGMNAAVFERLEMKQDLVGAVTDGRQMSVAFQPVVELASGRVVAVEALLRWHHPRRGPIPPAAFIPIAEETGLIHKLGLYVLDQACSHLRTWIDLGRELDVHVNVSVRQLEDDRFVSSFTETVRRYRLPPHAVVLELTESIPAAPAQRAALEELHRLGVRIALDDFGTGYTNWGYLSDTETPMRRLPVDMLKLDRSFVSCLGSEETVDVVRAIIEMAKAQGVIVVAEGIEQPQERSILGALGCHQGQGRLFADPLAFEMVNAYLAASVERQESARS